MTAVDISLIQISLRDRIPRTAQQLANRIANRLSEKRRSSGSTIVDYAPAFEAELPEDVMHTLQQNYGGAASRSVNPFGSKGPI